MKKAISTIVLILSIKTAGLACAPAAMESVENGKRLFANRLDLSQAKSAWNAFRQAAEADPACAEAALLASRAAWWVGDRSTDRVEKIKLFQAGMDSAKVAVSLSSSPAAHFWLAANMGSFGESKGVLKSLFLVKPIRAELNEIIKLDPVYDRGAAQRVLGVVDYKVPGFAGGNRKRALAQLQKALELGPNVGFNRYYLAEFYVTTGDSKQALEQLDVLKTLTAEGDDRPELVVMQEKGEALRKKIRE